MFNIIIIKLNNFLHKLGIKENKIIRVNSHNNDIKISYNPQKKLYIKKTSTAYGKKLLNNELDGLKWYSSRLKNDSSKLIFNYNFNKKYSLINIKNISGIKINYLSPLSITSKKIYQVIKYYTKVWPSKKISPCHGDFTFDNIIFLKNKVYIIDWECFNKKGEFWGYDLVYLVLSAASFPYYERGLIPKNDQKILRTIWNKLRSLKLSQEILNSPFHIFQKEFKKQHWKKIIKKSPKKLFPLIVNKNFVNHVYSIINK